MTAHTEADPAPEQPWRETSSPGVRRFALQQCEAAIRAARERCTDRQASKVTQDGQPQDARESAPAPAHGTNSRRAGQESSDAGQNVQREMRGSA